MDDGGSRSNGSPGGEGEGPYPSKPAPIHPPTRHTGCVSPRTRARELDNANAAVRDPRVTPFPPPPLPSPDGQTAPEGQGTYLGHTITGTMPNPARGGDRHHCRGLWLGGRSRLNAQIRRRGVFCPRGQRLTPIPSRATPTSFLSWHGYGIV